jgi:riboflavin kinase/FMN adenylyltransferase
MIEPFEVASEISEVAEKKPTFLAIGVFDGVHLGHQKMLSSMASAAHTKGARAAALTFYPHPITIIQGRRDRLYLCTLTERVELLAEQGLDLVITQTFDEKLRRTSASDFVDQLCQHINLKQLWGGTFGLGYNREGDLPFLRHLGQKKGFTVHKYGGMVEWKGSQVSSSRVRQSLRNGQVEKVSGLLGRPYRLTGRVIPGDGRGKQLGIPTANLRVWEEQLLPATGVYAAYAWLGEKRFPAASNIGYRPTVDGHGLNVEAHLLDFDAEIYGRELSLEFVKRIRDEKKFAGLEELVAQIKADIMAVRELLVPQ